MATPDPIATGLPAHSAAGRARATALAAYAPPEPATEWVEYHSRGRLLIIGAADTAWPLAKTLAAQLDCVVVATRRPAEPPESSPPAATVYGAPRKVSGYLGAFTIELEDEAGHRQHGETVFGAAHAVHDLVLDLQATPAIPVELPPPGYTHAPDAPAQAAAVAALPDLVGRFQKPRYFHYDASICAHGERGLAGCRNCLDACATGAAFSSGERIDVDPYLCQGCGSCATSCPTGAITYALPPAGDLLSSLRRLLASYREAGGDDPVVAFHGEDYDPAALQDLPEHVLPIALEDIGALGLEVWLSLLAYGARQVLLLAPADAPPTLVDTTRGQIELASLVLQGLGDPHAGERIRLLDADAAFPTDAAPLPPVASDYASFAPLGDKREIFRLALAHLQQHAAQPVQSQPLPAHAPFGAIAVDRDACTLCMACVSVCPAAAVQGGGDEPKLWFDEARCVQCGLCETACPEDAIRLAPQMDFAAHLQPQKRLLNEEPMQHCLDCGTAFATRKIVARMQEKLRDHWMYQGERARQLLSLCEDCRLHRTFDDAEGFRAHRD